MKQPRIDAVSIELFLVLKLKYGVSPLGCGAGALLCFLVELVCINSNVHYLVLFITIYSCSDLLELRPISRTPHMH